MAFVLCSIGSKVKIEYFNAMKTVMLQIELICILPFLKIYIEWRVALHGKSYRIYHAHHYLHTPYAKNEISQKKRDTSVLSSFL